MSRRHAAEKREILPDAKFGDRILSKFMNNLMIDGKKSVAEKIVYNALDRVEAKIKRAPVEVFHEALENIKPAVASDGGNILFESYDSETKKVNVILQGACSGCPSSTITLKSGIETMLKDMLPGMISEVNAING